MSSKFALCELHSFRKCVDHSQIIHKLTPHNLMELAQEMMQKTIIEMRATAVMVNSVFKNGWALRQHQLADQKKGSGSTCRMREINQRNVSGSSTYINN